MTVFLCFCALHAIIFPKDYLEVSVVYSLFNPRLCVTSLFDIDLNQLRQQGIKGIIFDLDNTIVPWDSADMCPKITSWLHELVVQDFKVVIVSNNWNKRVKLIADRFNLPFVSRAYKPAKRGFHQALAAMGLQAKDAAVVGDQLFTDVLGGNRMGMYTIWVKPLTSHEFIGTRVHRKLENIVIRILKEKGLMK